MKKKVILIGLLTLVSMSMISGILLFKNRNVLKLKEQVFIYELGDKISFKPGEFLASSVDKKVVNNSKLDFKNSYSVDVIEEELKSSNLDYLKVGLYEVVLTYKDKSTSFEIKVEDTTKPEFIDFKEEIVIEKDALNVDLTKFYEAKDLSGVTVVVESDYDLSKDGEYDALIKAVDQYKNINEKKAKIKVIKTEDITDNNLTSTLDGEIYKSQKRIDEENKPKESHNVAQGNIGSTHKNTQSNNQVTNNQPVSVATYRRDIANEYVSRINSYRKENGLSELPVTAEAQNEADMRAKQLVTNYSHNSSYGFGENIGNNVIGFDFVTAWKNSWSHNNAMLREQNTAIAVSIYEVDGWWYAVTSFKMNY